jgi:hypothetical protein
MGTPADQGEASLLAFKIFLDVCCLVGYIYLFVRYVRWGRAIWREK